MTLQYSRGRNNDNLATGPKGQLSLNLSGPIVIPVALQTAKMPKVISHIGRGPGPAKGPGSQRVQMAGNAISSISEVLFGLQEKPFFI